MPFADFQASLLSGSAGKDARFRDVLISPAQPVDQESFRLHVIVVDGEVFARDEDRGQLEQRHAVPRRGERLVGSAQRGVMRGADTETLAPDRRRGSL
jgi:hypothetical protein